MSEQGAKIFEIVFYLVIAGALLGFIIQSYNINKKKVNLKTNRR